MKPKPTFYAPSLLAVLGLLGAMEAYAATTSFFYPHQIQAHVASGSTSETISSTGYSFEHSLDKWWYPTISIGGGTPTGRFQSVVWPSGLHAQAITAGPSGSLPGQGGASIVVRRLDGGVFDLAGFTAKLLGNTAGAGASFEIMPTLNGNDGLPDPLMLDATGYGGQTFVYTTPGLKGFDTYNINLWMDFALTGIVLVDPSPTPSPTLFATKVAPNSIRLSWSVDATGYRLQSSSSIAALSFSDVPTQPTTQNGMKTVTLACSADVTLFRLAQ